MGGFQPLQPIPDAALAESLDKISLVYFANWRWCILAEILSSLEDILPSFAKHFDPACLKNNKDQVKVLETTLALRDADWHGQFEFVHWICRWLVGTARWIGGCSCHEQQLLRGEIVECDEKARMIGLKILTNLHRTHWRRFQLSRGSGSLAVSVDKKMFAEKLRDVC